MTPAADLPDDDAAATGSATRVTRADAPAAAGVEPGPAISDAFSVMRAAATATRDAAAPVETGRFAELIGSVHDSWRPIVATEVVKPYFAKLMTFVEAERAKREVFPPAPLVLNALRLSVLQRINVVILGQDPYHGRGQAHGLAFSVPTGVTLPPSLRNILKEVADDTGVDVNFDAKRPNGCLEHWAVQGVLLLNTVLTVQSNNPASHAGQGWETFTSAVITEVVKRREGVVFLLWGKPAQTKASIIKKEGAGRKHLILEAPHPSPLSAHKGFFGCKHFSKTNAYLKQMGRPPIDWSLSTGEAPPPPSASLSPTATSATTSASAAAGADAVVTQAAPAAVAVATAPPQAADVLTATAIAATKAAAAAAGVLDA